uniref:Discoidin, CUB and LCCL domain containing 1 n=1 Tax=Esox lucius TaxID=8010 RepID=A0AAY5JXB8_ESOLU
MSGKKKLHGFFVVWSILSVFGEKPGDGCGHSVLGPESGVLSSKNYPGTYPNNTWCEWKIQVPHGKNLVLRFGDLDVEARDCQSDYVKVLKGGYGGSASEFCGSLKPNPKVHTNSNEVIVQFQSGRHISGRGFLLSYFTGDHKDLLTCLDKGSHFSVSKYRKYCPAGCKAVAGEISGDISQGYRHTSVLCKAAVHAGVILDELGGWVSVETHKGLSHYPATRSNGIQSKENQSVLRPVAVTASSWWQKGGEFGLLSGWAPNSSQADPGSVGHTWAADQNDSLQWLQLDLGEKKRVTGIITTGFTILDFYVRSFKIDHKERNRWKAYTKDNRSDYMIFEGNQDSVHQTRNTLNPPITARYLRIIPHTWHQKIAMRVELVGCPHVKVTPVPMETVPTKPKPPMTVEEVTEPVPSQTDLVKLAIIIVPTGLSVVILLIGLCVFKMLQKKKTMENAYGPSDAQETGCWKQIKQPFARHHSTEFTISYNSEKDPMEKLDLVTSTMAEYQPPLIGTGTVSRKGSTFRPMDTETREDPSDATTHYDYLHTANQYALPLTSQEPEYATPIIERHIFHKEGFLPDPASYSVPGVVLSKTPSFKTLERKAGVGASRVYQTPQVKTDRGHSNSEGVYDSPKVNKPVAKSSGGSDYQRPQAKPAVMESYSTPRDCVRVAHRPDYRLDPEGSSGGT